ncbi:MAG: YraN family protein [Bryobacteraceae bacterium]|jgi:putative endonuclease|nr:YraN family protein [Bryobacteraceae bacterium]
MLYKFADWLRHRARLRFGNAAAAMGRRGEDLAHRFLRDHGFMVVARNYRLASGAAEIDLVARDGETLVFVEVKSRATEEFGSPDRAVGLEKQRHMLRAALDYTRRADVEWREVRFDIVSIVFSEPPAIKHMRDVLPIRA